MLELRRYSNNPILRCIPDNGWESRAVFNPAALAKDGTVHLLYRAVGEHDQRISRLGYATSADGFTFRRESSQPAFAPKHRYEQWSIEDPRMVELGGTIYITYVVLTQQAYTYGQHALTALASTVDFRHFRRYGIITPKLADVDDRDTVLFPERIAGRYIMLHRPQMLVRNEYREYGSGGRAPSNIWITTSKNLRVWTPGQTLLAPQQWWEAKKIGIGAPPVKTDRGWLLIYHGVDEQNMYRAGAALLALENPQRVLSRLPYPILEPREEYETMGDTPNVVFPEGAALLGKNLFVYYGGADKVCAVATVELEELLEAFSEFPADRS